LLGKIRSNGFASCMYSTIHFSSLHICCWAFWQNCKERLLASPYLFVRGEQLTSHWTNFYEIWYVSAFQNTIEKIRVLLTL